MEPDPEEGRRRVEIKVPDVYRKVDQGVWAELEKFLFNGFLHASSTVQGRTFVFKTLNANEVRIIEMMRPHGENASEVRSSFRTIFIAHSVLMIDGQNVLVDRPRHMIRLMKAVAKLSGPIQDKIVSNLSSLNERASRLFPLAEPYSFESRSRFRWLQMKGTPVHSSAFTGFPGTEDVGMNYCQQVWTAMNNIQDRRDELERDWSNAKFIGSCMAGKGIRSIDEKDKMRFEKERVEREDAKMKILYSYLNRTAGIPEPEATVQLPDGRMANVSKKFQAESVDELAEQLSASLSGEKDFHDRVIEEKERGFRERAAAIEEQKRLFFSRTPALTDGSRDGGSRVLGGRAEAEAHLRRMQAMRDAHIDRTRQRVSPGAEASDEPAVGGSE